MERKRENVYMWDDGSAEIRTARDRERRVTRRLLWCQNRSRHKHAPVYDGAMDVVLGCRTVWERATLDLFVALISKSRDTDMHKVILMAGIGMWKKCGTERRLTCRYVIMMSKSRDTCIHERDV